MAKGDAAGIDSYERFLAPILGRISAENPLKASQVELFLRSRQGNFGNGRCR
jgi:hypothetical protein